MGVLKNDVGRPSNKTIKTRRLLTLLVIVLAFAAGFFISYILATKFDNNIVKTKTNKSKNKEKIVNKEISADEAKKIMEDRFIYYGFIDSAEVVNSNNYKTFVAINHTKKSESTYKCNDLFDSLYKSDYLNEEDWIMKIKDDEYEYICTDNTEYTYNYKSVNNKYHDLFYNSKNENALKGYVGQGFPSYYVYSKNKDVYALVDTGGHWGIKSIFGIKKAEIKNNELIIDYAAVYGEFEDGEFVGKQESGKDIRIPADSDLSEAFDKYKDEIDATIRLRFKIVNGKYMFDKAEDI